MDALSAFRIQIHYRQARIYLYTNRLLLGADRKKEGGHVGSLARFRITERNHQANLGAVHLFHLVVL